MAKRRTRDETRRLLLDHGSRLLLSQGMAATPDIRLKEVCETLEAATGVRITPGSVYERIWRDQRDYQLAVLAEVLGQYDAREITQALKRAGESEDFTEVVTAADRDSAKTRYCRYAAGALIEATQGSRHWQIWVAASGCIASSEELRDDQRVRAAIEAGYERATEAISTAVLLTFQDFGYVIRVGLTEHQLGVALGSLIEGLALRLRFSTGHPRELPVGDGGADNPHGLLAVSFEALIDRFITHEAPRRW